uniref:Late embryogenesis abundant protein LEA-2 subgroup domain-containing protein n=1 Tax=Noccaea caerulescens TaxID=107243 RepID=A0A1J3E8F0_NOCCA
MAKHSSSSGRTNLASCAVATVFIVFLIIAAVAVYLTVFRPRDPEISVTNVKVPSFSVANSSVSFTFSQFSAVRNPNRAAFSHYNNKIQLFYYGNRIGFTFIPAGEIESGQTKRMYATFSVQSFPLSNSQISAADFQRSGSVVGTGLAEVDNRAGSTVEIESKLEMAGRVRVLGLFSHRIAAKSNCRIAISTSDGSIVAVRC